MANPEHLKILKQGVEVWSQWREKNPGIVPDLSAANLRGADLRGANFSGANLSGADLSGADLYEAKIKIADINNATISIVSGADLSEANLRGANLSGANLRGANLRGANLTRADLREDDLKKPTILRGADLHNAFLERANLFLADLRGANLSRADLSMVNLYGTDLREADLHDADLHKVRLCGANLCGANLCGANLDGADLSKANLDGANLSGADLHDADLSEVNLSGVKLIGTNLRGADLRKADLSKANLKDANLRAAGFYRAKLIYANMVSVDLRRCDMIDSNLDGAVLTGAKIWESKRSGWSIKGVICECAYFDRNGEEKTEFKPGEFEKLYSEKTRIVLHYKDAMNTVEVMTLPALIKIIESENSGSSLRLESIQEDAGGVNVFIVVEDLADNELLKLKSEAEQLKKMLRENQALLIQAEGKFLGLEQFMLKAWRENMGDTINVNQVTGVVKAESSTVNQNINTNDPAAVTKLISEILTARPEIEKALPPEKADELNAAFEVIEEQAKAPEKNWEKLKKGVQAVKNVLDGVGDTAGKWMPIVEKLAQAAQSLGMG